MVYTYQKVDVLIGRKNENILTAVRKDFFDQSYSFGAKQGLNFALAVIDPFDPTPL